VADKIICCKLLHLGPVRQGSAKHAEFWRKDSKTKNGDCKISGFHGRDYEECRLLGYKNPFCTSATEVSLLLLCKI
jgi:hypothetical protein